MKNALALHTMTGGVNRTEPMFTVVTATFNAGLLFERTSASLRSQTDQDFQWLVIDGASTDSTLEKIALTNNRVDEWISEVDQGIADAWNKGLARARGTYVLFLNAGDTYDPSFLALVRSRAYGRRIVCSHARLRTPSGAQVGWVRAEPHKLGRAMHVPHNWCAVPKCWYDELGPYALLPQAMDFEWFHRYHQRFGAAGFDVIDEALGDYYLGGVSDIHFAESYRTNERIIVANGGTRLRARFWRWAYTLNHAIRRRGF